MLVVLFWLTNPAMGQERRTTTIDFAHDIVPILKTHCASCHANGRSEGDFSLETREKLLAADVVVVGKARESRLIELVQSKDADEQMPPEGKPRLSASEIEKIGRWIDQGLPWEAGVTLSEDQYDPPLRHRAVELPPARSGRTHPLDRIIDTYLEAHGQPIPSPIDDATFLRRLSFDLVGLPPTEEELDAFLADRSPQKRQRAVDRLLGRDADFAAHWMTYWNDLLRNAYAGTGFIDGGRKQITEWLYRSLLQNKPYDQFVRELIAPGPESEGFVRGIKWRGNVNASQRREIQFAQSVAQVMLGINMKCASCHDSFIDRWTLNEAYGLAAVYATGPLEIHRCDKPTGQIAQPAWIFPELGQLDPKAPQPERLTQLAKLMTHPDNGRLTRTIANRIWRQLMGRGIVHPVDAMHTRPWNEDLLDYLALYLRDHDYDLRQLIRLIVTSQAYQSRAVVLKESPSSDQYVYPGPRVKRLTAEQFLDAVRSILDVWPTIEPRMLKPDGRGQGGQLAAVLRAEGRSGDWGDRPLRTVFTFTDPLQASLGRPNREQVVSVRPETLTTLEAIHLSNGPILADLLRQGARRMVASDEEPGRLVDRLFRQSLSRPPTVDERVAALEMLGEDPGREEVEDLLWALFVLPEFQFLR